MGEPVAEGLLGSQGNIRTLLLGEPVTQGLLGSQGNIRTHLLGEPVTGDRRPSRLAGQYPHYEGFGGRGKVPQPGVCPQR
ncbi:hypothetical protein KAM329D_15760 [Aeromonas caviae]|nr:hypothetical protein KAM329_003200 [Aeromonas caviae]GJC22595.1 hypothetical protein KAM329D_15760 [Aeromonas caviae]